MSPLSSLGGLYCEGTVHPRGSRQDGERGSHWLDARAIVAPLDEGCSFSSCPSRNCRSAAPTSRSEIASPVARCSARPSGLGEPPANCTRNARLDGRKRRRPRWRNAQVVPSCWEDDRDLAGRGPGPKAFNSRSIGLAPRYLLCPQTADFLRDAERPLRKTTVTCLSTRAKSRVDDRDSGPFRLDDDD